MLRNKAGALQIFTEMQRAAMHLGPKVRMKKGLISWRRDRPDRRALSTALEMFSAELRPSCQASVRVFQMPRHFSALGISFGDLAIHGPVRHSTYARLDAGSRP